jgi:hypothetical protein
MSPGSWQRMLEQPRSSSAGRRSRAGSRGRIGRERRFRSSTREVFAMSRIRSILLSFACLAGIVPLVAAPSSIAAAPGPNPNKPIVIPVDDTFQAPNLSTQCGFYVEAHVYGSFTFKVLRNGIEMDRLHVTYDFTGPGGTTTTHRVENVKYTATYSADGILVESITASGDLAYHVIVPGSGSLGNNSGHEVVQLTWQYNEGTGEYDLVDEQVWFDSGPNDDVTAEDYAIICGVLG